MIQIRTKCKECGTLHEVLISTKQYVQLNTCDMLTQNIFPELTPEQRELHFISGICGNCWDKLFGEDE